MLRFWDIFRIVAKHVWLFTIVTILTIIVGFSISFLQKAHIYSSSAELVANTNSELVGSFKAAISGKTVLQPVSKSLLKRSGYQNYTVSRLQQNVTVHVNPGVAFFTIEYHDVNPQHANLIVNRISQYFESHANNIFDGTAITVSAYSKTAQRVAEPSKAKFLLISAIIGLSVALIVTLLSEMLSTKTDVSLDPLDACGIKVFGKLKRIDAKEKINQQQLQLIGTRIAARLTLSNSNIITISTPSTESRDKQAEIVRALALFFVRSGLRVAIGHSSDTKSDEMKTIDENKLRFVPVDMKTDLVGNLKTQTRLIQQLKTKYDVILFDLGSANHWSSKTQFTTMSDLTIELIFNRETNKRDFKSIIQELRAHHLSKRLGGIYIE